MFSFRGKNDEYKKVGKLGGGTYGAVFKVSSVRTGNFYALKVFTNEMNELNFSPEEIKRVMGKPFSDFNVEAGFSKLLEDGGQCSPYVTCSVDVGKINAYDIINHLDFRVQQKVQRNYSDYCRRLGRYPTLYFLVQELMDGDIGNIPRMNIDTPSKMKDFMVQVLKGVQWLHQKGVAHNDIKNENIFYKKEGRKLVVKLGDLGSACSPMNSILNVDCEGFATPIYGSPTVLNNFWEPISLFLAQKGDMWAVGIVFYAYMRYQEIQDNDIYNLLPYDYDKFYTAINNSVKKIQGQLMEQGDIAVSRFTSSEEPNIVRKINHVLNGLLLVDDDDRYDAGTALDVLLS